MNQLTNLKNKNIALFGNSMSLIYKERPTIDNNHDIFIRINKGTTNGVEKWIGSKTDFISLSLNLSKEEIKSLFGEVKGILYCSPKHRLGLNEYLQKNAEFYPYQNWSILEGMLGARPSTGIMTIDYLWHYVEFRQLHIYGFDFWESNNIYTDIKHIGPHDPFCEKEYLTRLIHRDKRIFRHE